MVKRSRLLRATALLIAFVLGAVSVRVVERVRLGDAADDLAVFEAALRITHDNYVEKQQAAPRQLVYDAIDGMIDGLGDTGHSRFLTAEERRRERRGLEGTVTGIGVEMAERDGQPVIVTVYPGSPAERAGLRAGERFLSIDGEDVSALSLSGLGERLRGPTGSTFRATLRRADGATYEVELRREDFHVPFVTWALLADSGLAHIRISQFGEDAAEELDRALAGAKQAGARGIVLDLRDNPGGLLEQAVEVTSRFLREGVVLIERDRSGDRDTTRVKQDAPRTDLPLVLLVNGGSASAAEVTAAALIHHGRAAAAGDKTYGTGTVLRTFGLPDGSALLLGVEEWLTPAGEPLRGRGVTPAITVKLPQGTRPVFPVRAEPGALDPCRTPDTQLRAAAAHLGVTCPTP